MLKLEIKNLEVFGRMAVARPHTGNRPVPAPVGSGSGGWAGLVMSTKRSFLWRLTASLTSSPDSVMGNCHQMTMGGELLLLLSSALYHKGSSCDYRQLMPQLLIEHYLLLTSSFWLIFGKHSTCCMRALLVIPGRDDLRDAFLGFRFGNTFGQHLQTAQISNELLFLARQTFTPRSEAAFDFPQVDRIN